MSLATKVGVSVTSPFFEGVCGVDCFLNISPIGGYRGGAGFGVYSSKKLAVKGLSEALHDELAPLGIHVTVVEPSYLRTDFLDSSSLWFSANIIGDYAETASRVRAVASSLTNNQPGDPQKLAEVPPTTSGAN